MRALVGIDGSQSAVHAARRARELLPDGTSLVLVTVTPPPIDPNEGAGGFAGPTMTPEEAEHDYAGSVVVADAMLAETARQLGAEPFDQRVVSGVPAEALCALARELGVDVVVVGSHEKRRLERAVLGSTSRAIVRSSPVSVLIIPPPHD